MRKRIICPSCGSVEVKYNNKTKEFHCSYCETNFNIKTLQDARIQRINPWNKKMILIAGSSVVLLAGIIASIVSYGNKPQKQTIVVPSISLNPTKAVEPTSEPIYDLSDDSKDVWTRVLENVFQESYSEISKEQLESIQFLGFYYDEYHYTVVVQVGFEDFFTYNEEKEFKDTILTYEFKHIDDQEYEQALQQVSEFSGITVLQTDGEVDQRILASFPYLKGLALKKCENPYFLAKFPDLKQLYLENAPVRDYLASLTKLESLTLVNCDLDQVATWMTEFNDLQLFVLRDCQETIPLNYEILSTLPKLQEVSMIHCEMNYEINGILKIPNLVTLNLSDSEFYLNPKDVTLPNTLTNVVLDNITPHDFAYEIMDGESYRSQKNKVPVDTIKKLLTPSPKN